MCSHPSDVAGSRPHPGRAVPKVAPVTHRPPALLLAALLLLSLSACTSDRVSGPRLADAKSVVQLVRNEAGDRVPPESVQRVEVISDASETCDSATEDPDGIQRRWVSSSAFTLAPGSGATLEATYADLINSFSGDGWSEVTYGGRGSVTLQKPESLSTLSFLATPEDVGAGTAASITISVASGCVATAGSGSDEVTLLEESAD